MDHMEPINGNPSIWENDLCHRIIARIHIHHDMRNVFPCVISKAHEIGDQLEASSIL
ncbi:hypothetical protein BAP_4046 [Bacillus sp. CN2]|nr:hypothetical protein BAP_4046 [Bacillus sp. CN2]